MSNVIYRTLNDDHLPKIIGARGSWLHDVAGQQYLDMSSGPCCFSLGYSNDYVLTAIEKQARQFPTTFSGFWRSDAAEKAADILADHFNKVRPKWFGGVLFLQGGGEAVDLTCKLTAQYHLEAGEQRIQVAVREHCFHGVGTLPFAMSGYYPRYDLINPYEKPALSYVVRVPGTYTNYPDHALNQTRKILQQNPKVSALFIEPIGGPPIGAHVEEKSYMVGLRKLCDELGILLVFDEILCGAGRCGYMSMAEAYSVWPDIILLGKGISAGYQPVSVIVLSNKVTDRIKKGSGTIMFGTTQSAHSMGCAAVWATIDYIQKTDLLFDIREHDCDLYFMLEDHLAEVTCVSKINGMGFLKGISLTDPRTSKPFDPKLGFHAVARRAILEQGCVVYSKGQTVNGQGDFLIVAPPFETLKNELEMGVNKIKIGLQKAYAMVSAHANA